MLVPCMRKICTKPYSIHHGYPKVILSDVLGRVALMNSNCSSFCGCFQGVDFVGTNAAVRPAKPS